MDGGGDTANNSGNATAAVDLCNSNKGEEKMNEELGAIGTIAQIVFWTFLMLMGFLIGRKWEKMKRKDPQMYCTLLKNGRVIMTPDEYKELKKEAVRSPRSKLERRCRSAKVIAVDFDGTLCGEGWEINPWLVDQLKEAQKRGAQLILHTSRSGSSVDWAVEFCKSLGIEFARVVGDKPIADLYIDDKALESVWPIDF